MISLFDQLNTYCVERTMDMLIRVCNRIIELPRHYILVMLLRAERGSIMCVIPQPLSPGSITTATAEGIRSRGYPL